MQPPDHPADEPTRLASLRALSILDTPPEERFDRVTRLARRLFDVPIAVVSLVDEHRQWFKSCAGIDIRETPRDVSFCGHAILDDEVLVIPDASNDPRFVDNPLVLGDPPIRFYAGCPLRTADGSRIGTLCIIDTRPRELAACDLVSLRDLAYLIEKEICAVELATLDDLTRISNRRGFEALGRQALEACRRNGKPASLLYLDLDMFKQINDRFGHHEGDRALIVFARTLYDTFRDSDVVGRLGGDEFAILLTGLGPDEVRAAMHRLHKAIEQLNQAEIRRYNIRYSCGGIEFDPEKHQDMCALIADADQQMYHHKRRRRYRPVSKKKARFC